MLKLEDLKPGVPIVGLEPASVATVAAVVPIGDGAVQVFYRTPDGTTKERLLGRDDEANLSVATVERPWSFDGDGAAFQLTCEAKRIDLAFLFDPMMAVHTSNVEPLPHQITAVYESMLPRQPLRFVLADDPGAGKTIMAGLYIRELVMRADAHRILIVTPGSLVEQWRDELHEKFGLEFRIYSSELEQATPGSNPFEENNYLIVRLDQLSRAEEQTPTGRAPGDLQIKLLEAGWDLVVFDEAHKLSAHYFGSKLEKTARFRLAERLGERTRHLLLMTATPHNGKEEDFQLFLSLLDSDRFYGRFRGDAAHQVDCSDLMRRMVKEELVKFDNTPLFPERKAYTVNYNLSEIEAALYESVTDYVKTEMGKADELTGSRKGTVGFALTALQRRLASSPEAIYQSLRRRKERLVSRLREEKMSHRGTEAQRNLQSELCDFVTLCEPYSIPEDDDDLNAEEQETLEETLVDRATAAQTIQELEAEIEILERLEAQARAVVASGQDRKWDELSKILQTAPEMRFTEKGSGTDCAQHPEGRIGNRYLTPFPKSGTDCAQHPEGRSGNRYLTPFPKLIIFSEHRDTLNYLHEKIAGVIGNHEAVVTIHGGTHRDERRRIQALFRSDPDVRVLVATDAAGEGVNLQCANLMVNYDLPWNPNRLEQRLGRIHRIGQVEVCHLWNLVAKETREGDVYHRLLKKLEVESEALKGRVFDILGKVFEETSLKDLLIQAIRYGDQPEVRSRLSRKIDQALDHDHLKSLLNRNALAQETMTAERLYAVKEEMEKAEARRLQPYFVRSFFLKAFEQLGGSIYPREAGRFEITHVPASIRERDRRISGRNRREQEPVLKRYDRICFEKEAVQPLDRPGLSRAVLMHPGHPLMLAVTDLILEQHANLLRQGAVLVDPADEGTEPWLMFLLTHEVKSGDGQVLSKRLQFVRVNPDGSTSFAGWAPHLDLEPLELFMKGDSHKGTKTQRGDEENGLSDSSLSGSVPPCDASAMPAAKESLADASGYKQLVASILEQPWIRADMEQRAVALAATSIVPEHFREVYDRRVAHVDKTLAAVHERLTREIDFWSDRWLKLKEDQEAGKDVRLNVENARRTIIDLEGRLENRKKELQSMRHVVNGTPIVLGGALVLPAGLMRHVRGQQPDASAREHFADPIARSRIERIAMDAVRKHEESQGRHVVDVSADKCGWDLTSYPPHDLKPDASARDYQPQPEPRHIEVKGRINGADTITVTRNEILYAFNQGDKFVLAIVLVNEDDTYQGPYYIRRPFDREPGWGVSSINYNLSDLLQKADSSMVARSVSEGNIDRPPRTFVTRSVSEGNDHD